MEPQADNTGDANEAMRELLQAHGIVPTRQRMEIAGQILAAPQHLSADDVLARVGGSGVHVSKATVYNTLGLFAEKGLVREVIVDPARVFYDSNTHRHHHFYNVDTGELTDVPAEQFTLGDLPPSPEGTRIDDVDVVIRLRRT